MATMSTSPSNGRPRGRPLELEDWLNRFIYHPLSGRLARALVPTGISPNAVSVMGGLFIAAAAWAYTGLDAPQSALLGFAFQVAWHVFDGADGDLARLTGKASPVGELVDGVCDYAGHAVLYVALAAFLDDRIGISAWPLATVAALSHGIQANHSESQRRTYLWWAYGVPWLKNSGAREEGALRRGNWFAGMFGWMADGYVRLATAMNPDAETVDKAVASVGDPSRLERLRALVKQRSRTSLLLQKSLGANPRAPMLFVSMAFGSPIYFFVAEIVLLNLLLVASVQYHKAHSRQLAQELARA
jgi:phosphatidylglycerophosphate synthase